MLGLCYKGIGFGFWKLLLARRSGALPKCDEGKEEMAKPASSGKLQRSLLALALFLFAASTCSLASVLAEPEAAKIELSLRHRVLRGDILVVSGRLSTQVGDHPIPLAKVHLQYYGADDTEFTREVTMRTSTPGGLFEDRFNTTSLLRVGTWFVNASFPSQLGYESTSTVETFTIFVQPALSLYLSSRKIPFGQGISFEGLLFACIPCIQDEVTVIFSRPDNTSISISVNLTPIGAPYPGGYYSGEFKPDAAGVWRIRTIWKGNEVTLPAYSSVEELDVEEPGTKPDQNPGHWILASAIAAFAFALVLFWTRRHLRKPPGVSQ